MTLTSSRSPVSDRAVLRRLRPGTRERLQAADDHVGTCVARPVVAGHMPSHMPGADRDPVTYAKGT
ncbi:hypothetical protein GCM10010350_72770 [Streptomyces galilaeus]|nr:hypothetical protein GCM10010350_72770 [Streptomyces galilaeus]